MAAEVVHESSGHPVHGGLDLVRQGLDLLLGSSTWSLSDGEVRAALVGLTAQAGRVEAARAVLVRESVSREVPDSRGQQGARTVNLLKATCRLAPARASADVANAKVTCPDTGELRGLGAAWAAGQVSGGHVDVARRCLVRLPKGVVRERRADVDAELTDHARQWDPGTADLLARHLLSVVAPDLSDRYDENALERRHLGVCVDSTGMVLVRGQLDQAAGFGFVATLDHLVAQDRAAGGIDVVADDHVVVDVRTRGQRRADALGRMVVITAEQLGIAPSCQSVAAHAVMEQPDPPTEPIDAPEQNGSAGAGEVLERAEVVRRETQARQRAVRSVPRVVVVTTPEQLEGAAGAGAAVTTDGSLLGHGTLTRMTCDAVVDRVVLAADGRVLSMDTLGRLATVAQQHALAARDGGCTWPGCTAPPALCEAHHVVWWSRGGPTTIDNLALLCHRHHTQVHAEPDDGWQMVIRDGLPWFRPPDRVGRSHELRRNTFHQALEAARRTGKRWRTCEESVDTDPDPPRAL